MGFGKNLNLWDISSGVLLVKEAVDAYLKSMVKIGRLTQPIF